MKTAFENFVQKRRRRQWLMTISFFAILIGGWFYPLLGYFLLFCMIAAIAITFFRGREWCDWLCPRGSFYDACYSHISRKRKIPDFLRKVWFRAIVMGIMMIVLGIQLYIRWPNVYAIGKALILILTVSTIVGILFGYFTNQRAWCLMCPIGSMAALLGGDKHALKIDSAKCVECKLCEMVCPMQIKPYAYKKTGIERVAEKDCLKCSSCVERCPEKALEFDLR
ncbi:MAG: 4Fe-4S ferredoxin iron-sulfur binding protein [uncultured bacterium]|nr:MAG: 4Fe-4S ferredoxin iron-sulfur binding protein [uncultured bacterium]